MRGPLRADESGSLVIAGLRVAGLDLKLAGRRVSLAGERREQVFEPANVVVEPTIPFVSMADRLCLEAYVAASGDAEREGAHREQARMAGREPPGAGSHPGPGSGQESGSGRGSASGHGGSRSSQPR